jgi:glycosyltransferase involved in cell wall biosynthesis
MSIALLEALSAGLPVVVTATGGTEELVTPGANGLVVPWADVERLTAALRQLIDAPQLRKAMGAKSRARASALSWGAIAQQYVEVMQRVISASPLQPHPR